MNDLVFVKRKSHIRGCRNYHKPIIKLELNCGRFIMSQPLIELLNLNESDGVMFGFNQKNKNAFIMKDNEEDAFYFKRKDVHSVRFTSKDLMEYFVDTFDILETGKNSFYFDVEKFDKKMYKLTLKNQ